MKWWAIYANLQVDAIATLSIPLSGDKQDQEIFLVPSGHNQTRSYNTESSNQHLYLWNIRLNAWSHSKMKWWAIYTNLAVNAIVTLPHPRSGDNPAQETFLAPSADNQTRNDEIQYSNHYLSILTLRLKGLTRSKIKWWAIYKNLQVGARGRLPHPRSRDSQCQKKILAPSADKQTCNSDKECWYIHPNLSTLRLKELSRSNMKWGAIYTNLLVDVIVRLTHSRSKDSQDQETFLAPSADKRTRNYGTECSNNHPSLSTLRLNGLTRSKMKW